MRVKNVFMQKKTALTPRYATEFEQALASLQPDLASIDLAIGGLGRMGDGDKVQADYLPWLAWGRSLDLWEVDWTEAQKRKVMQAAWIVHRYKGTRRSIEAALATIGFEADIREWFETSGVKGMGAPRTFEVVSIFPEEARFGGDGLMRLVANARRMIDATKPVSAHYSFSVGQKITGVQRLGVNGLVRVVDTRTPHVKASAEAVRSVGAALVGHIRNTASTVAMRIRRGPVVAVFGKLEAV